MMQSINCNQQVDLVSQIMKAVHANLSSTDVFGTSNFDETSCDYYCPHPFCWKSNERKQRGFPRLSSAKQQIDELEYEFPTVNFYELLLDATLQPGDSSCKTESKDHFTQSANDTDRSLALDVPSSTPRFPVDTPVEKHPMLSMVEMENLTSMAEIENKAHNRSGNRQFYVWKPGNLKKNNVLDALENMETMSSNVTHVSYRDMTEDLVPKDIEREREATRMKLHSHLRRGDMDRPYLQSVTPSYPQRRQQIDVEGITELLSLPRDMLLQVLEHCKPGDFICRTRLLNVIAQFSHTTNRGLAQDALTDKLLRQQSLKLLERDDNSFMHKPAILGDGRPVFRMDDDQVINRMSEANTPIPGDLDNLSDIGSSRDSTLPLLKFTQKKALPPITKGNAEPGGKFKIPSISLGFPALPTGLSATRPFAYNRTDFDFTLAPMPTPPSSLRSVSTACSDLGSVTRTTCASRPSSKTSVSSLERSVLLKAAIGDGRAGSKPSKQGKRTSFSRSVKEASSPVSTTRWGVAEELTAEKLEKRSTTSPLCISTPEKISMTTKERCKNISPSQRNNDSSSRVSSLEGHRGKKVISLRQSEGVYETNNVNDTSMSAPGQRGSSAVHSTVSGTYSSSISPDPWPIDVIERQPSPVKSPLVKESTVPESVQVGSVKVFMPDTKLVQKSLKSPSPTDSDLTCTTATTSSAKHSVLAKLEMNKRQTDRSPAPPPPSPEAYEMSTSPHPVNPAVPSTTSMPSRREHYPGCFSSKSHDSVSMQPVLEEADESEGDQLASAVQASLEPAEPVPLQSSAPESYIPGEEAGTDEPGQESSNNPG